MKIPLLTHLPLDAQERLARHPAVPVQDNDVLRGIGVSHIIWTPPDRFGDIDYPLTRIDSALNTSQKQKKSE